VRSGSGGLAGDEEPILGGVGQNVAGRESHPQHGPQPLDLAHEFGDDVQLDLGG
jgi:hypothetical protein